MTDQMLKRNKMTQIVGIQEYKGITNEIITENCRKLQYNKIVGTKT